MSETPGMIEHPLNVAVLMGGPSAEAAVSRASAAEVSKGLQAAGHRSTVIELDRQCAARLLELSPDVVFPALHGPPGEDGTVQGFLELLGFPYVGSGVHGSAVAMDKSLAKVAFRRACLPVAEEIVVEPGDCVSEAAQRITKSMGDRVVIKPLRQGSALGITRLPNGGDLQQPLQQALRFGHGVLVEPYVLGREITVGVLDLHGQQPLVLPVIEIRTAAEEWYDYANRYTVGKSLHIIPAELPQAVLSELQQIALRAHAALGLRDLSRADFLVTESNGIVLLEVNTLPGMTPTSLFPDGAAALDIGFPSLMDKLVRSALARGIAPD
ncbi:MAG: D-alanine--D-alanine ligase family protein [Pseudomonadales bacterium]